MALEKRAQEREVLRESFADGAKYVRPIFQYLMSWIEASKRGQSCTCAQVDHETRENIVQHLSTATSLTAVREQPSFPKELVAYRFE